ncbi:MAG TPA: hypothetical protein VKE92_14785, partial [Anaerolineales bacterium]|nr:hypothetical protein [Anaerolineales bacterium]
WPYQNIVFASEKPVFVKWDERDRLHCPNGPAVEYADGYALYAYHGTRIPREKVIAEAPDFESGEEAILYFE